jgi:LPXTG-motif cell wall-anchored protein
MEKGVLAAGMVLASLWMTTASPSVAANGYDADEAARDAAAAQAAEAAEPVEEEGPVRQGMHLRTTPAPAAAAGIPALLALGAGFLALRRRRR